MTKDELDAALREFRFWFCDYCQRHQIQPYVGLVNYHYQVVRVKALEWRLIYHRDGTLSEAVACEPASAQNPRS